MFCHKCGTQIGPDVQFCPHCGESLAAPSASGGAAPPVWTPAAAVQARPGYWVGQGWQMVKADIGTFMLAGSTSAFGLSRDYAVILLTTAILVVIGARLYPRLAT